MGLDMYLYGNRYHWSNHEAPELNKQIEGFELKEEILQLGYWRKHPDLHGYIIQQFAEGKDECQEIELGKDDIEKIIKAITSHNLPKTTGCFFGESSSEDDNPSITIFTKALTWLDSKQEGISKSIIYRASW